MFTDKEAFKFIELAFKKFDKVYEMTKQCHDPLIEKGMAIAGLEMIRLKEELMDHYVKTRFKKKTKKKQ